MNNQDFAAVVDKQIAECREILGVKGLDYPMDASDRLSNFKHSAHRSGTSPMQAWLVFFLKHEECIEKFVRGEYHDSEPIEGRIADAINYLFLLRAIIEEARNTDEKQSAWLAEQTRLAQNIDPERGPGPGPGTGSLWRRFFSGPIS